MAINTDINIYGKQIPKSAVNEIKGRSDKPYGFLFPFTDNTNGGYFKKSSDLELIKGNLKQLLLTKRGERVMLPGFGTNLKNYLMEPMDQALFSQIKREIYESFNKYARNVEITKLQIFPGTTPTFNGGHSLLIKLFCTLKADQKINFELKVDIA